jgi:arylsulfatase A-like enzyme
MSQQPNIIYILTDDQRADMLGAAGHPLLKTPHLDQLAADGIRFNQAFCTSPVCTPSRACHYLGQWERRHGVNFNSYSSVSPVAWKDSFPMVLKKAGYFLGWVGKNHVPVGESGYKSGYIESVFD